ncbi:MAG: 5-formyltetrahydrofolate cyclo-ligase [Bacteroidales bacterium]|nr:5-formyltetrahydrofolate cyclo-ligase [Bacteroidales bacterium]
MGKQEIRTHIRAAKKAVPFFDRQSRSAIIMQHVSQLHAFSSAHVVLLYWSMPDEVQTMDFIDFFKDEKVILLPCVVGDNLVLKQYLGAELMQKGEQFGIGEPVGDAFVQLGDIDVAVVPGVAFDRFRNRMGRGRGFYDRLLKNMPNAYKVGVAFDFQLLDSIPVDPHDVCMDCVVTEREII